MSGAVDLEECVPHQCRHGHCAVCGELKHKAAHGPVFGQPPGSPPYDHEFVPTTNSGSRELSRETLRAAPVPGGKRTCARCGADRATGSAYCAHHRNEYQAVWRKARTLELKALRSTRPTAREEK